MIHMKGNVTHEGDPKMCSECNPKGWKVERQLEWENIKVQRALANPMADPTDPEFNADDDYAVLEDERSESQ